MARDRRLHQLQIPRKANPSPPSARRWGARLNIMEFCKQFNAATVARPGMPIPVVIHAFPIVRSVS